MNQRGNLKKLIIDFCNQQESRTFSLQSLNLAYGDYNQIGIGGKTPQATVRRLLQELRDERFISFLSESGHYTLRGIELLEKEKEDIKNIRISENESLAKPNTLEKPIYEVPN